ncbi:MAG: DNA gyrase/topoisomerase IV subunit A [Prevotellaceae bacterium]|jgi:topoisomerase-4 subunit A|nr:DNA gyrase/topoisomerase IV subunit A [Prevotellaceae bacterium]
MNKDDFKEGEPEQTNTSADDFISDETVDNQRVTLAGSHYKIPKIGDADAKYHLSGMYQTWFLDYASYVNLERAVPDIYDGLKPVQRRILFSMRRLDDGRYNKVANIVGHTMQFHPHGDASIGDALTNMGQKDLLIDCQGNWGNILTGDDAAAPRYIEARLSKFALETVFNPKTTDWKMSYDGRNKEPINLPVKFPLLLAQGTEGIGVGLNSKILPHNFNEIIDACIAHLHNEEFTLFPDFQTGGSVDISRYNDGERGGAVKVRAKITKIDNKTLAITEIPFSVTTGSLIDSIVKANDKGKIKIRKVDDNTAADVEILIHLQPGISPDKTIDALYAFTACEISISPNCCVIENKKPRFMGVSEMLRISAGHTRHLLELELKIQRDELLEQLFFTSLEKIFIENRIYKDTEFENATTQDIVIKHIYKRLEPFEENLVRKVTRDDIIKLLEIKMMRITKFDSDKANDTLISIKKKIKEVENDLQHIVNYTIEWFKNLKEKYGKNFPRKTEIRNFENIEQQKVVEANQKLYVNRAEGFIGTGLKKDEYVSDCSDIDDIIVFFTTGKYKIVKVAEKLFVGKNILYLNVFKKNDKRTVYNTVYRDGQTSVTYAKRFYVSGITRDKEYDLTQGTLKSKVIYFTANPNGEAEVIMVKLRPKRRLTKVSFEKNFSDLAIKGRQSIGNILTKNEILKIALKHKGASTLEGRKVWFDKDVLRLNYDGRGMFLGEFQSDDRILVINQKGDFYTANFDLINHFEPDLLKIEKFDANKIWTLAFFDAAQKFYYLKRFTLESTQKPQNIMGDNPHSSVMLLTDTDLPLIAVEFGGADAFRKPVEIDAAQFIATKSFKARGKRISTYNILEIKELETVKSAEESESENESEEEEMLIPDENENIQSKMQPDSNQTEQASLF